jgi:gamma-glutamylcyclotransferase
METSWYFAYGSNLCADQMVERTGSIWPTEYRPRIALLANHRLVFQHLEIGGPAFANILSSGTGVLGVVYRCSEANLDRLDHFEHGYGRQAITVTDRRGRPLAAVAYVMQLELARSIGRPDASYLERIVAGARQHGLSEQYIRDLVSVAGSAGREPEQ